MNQPIERMRRDRQARNQPALRLVDTRKIERADWLEVRKSGIGGSDAAAAVGLNPHKSALELWMEKTGRDAHLPQPDPTDTREPVFWGQLLEPIVAAAYTQQTGNRVRKVNAVLRHPTVPYMLANLDREVVGAPSVQILECKTAGEFGARLWRDGVPEYVQLQVQHQLAVTGKQAADVAVLLCGQKLEVYRIHRDDDLIARLAEPAFAAPKGLTAAAGVVIQESDGRIWMVCPTNQFAGYAVTFPKGRTDGKSLQAAALTEAFEESGLRVRLLRHLIDVRRTQTYTRYYLAERVGGTPSAMGWESQCVMLAPHSEIAALHLARPDVLVVRSLELKLATPSGPGPSRKQRLHRPCSVWGEPAISAASRPSASR